MGEQGPLPLDDAEALDRLDAAIGAAIPAARLLTPDDVRVAAPTPADAVRRRSAPIIVRASPTRSACIAE